LGNARGDVGIAKIVEVDRMQLRQTIEHWRRLAAVTPGGLFIAPDLFPLGIARPGGRAESISQSRA
jgi:hypothetical protein